VATVINGRTMAKLLKEELRTEVNQWLSEGHRPPHLTAILVGTSAPSATYVRNKMKAAAYVGSFCCFLSVVSFKCYLPFTTS